MNETRMKNVIMLNNALSKHLWVLYLSFPILHYHGCLPCAKPWTKLAGMPWWKGPQAHQITVENNIMQLSFTTNHVVLPQTSSLIDHKENMKSVNSHVQK